MSKKCPQCGKQSFTPFTMGSTVYMDVYKCNVCGAECMVTQLEDITVFDRITASPEVLAENVVYPYEMAIGGSTFRVYWTSPFVENFYPDKAEAIAATVAKLKEVCDAERMF